VKLAFRLFAVLAILFGAYFIANLPELYARVKLDRQNVGLSRYAFERTPEVVLVGSSMTFRAYEHYFSVPVRNLSVGGDSPLTGLSIIASYEKLPKLILVEINIMSRPVDRAVTAQFGKNPFEPYRWFRPARAVISAVYYWIKFNPETERIRQLLKIEPQDYDISQSVSDAVREYEAIDGARNAFERRRVAATNSSYKGSRIASAFIRPAVAAASSRHSLCKDGERSGSRGLSKTGTMD
jgi:hypothetical protein